MIQSKLMESIPNSTTFDIELDYEGEKRLTMFLMRPKKKTDTMNIIGIFTMRVKIVQ